MTAPDLAQFHHLQADQSRDDKASVEFACRLFQHPADVESERLDFLDAHQTLADLVVDECSN